MKIVLSKIKSTRIVWLSVFLLLITLGCILVFEIITEYKNSLAREEDRLLAQARVVDKELYSTVDTIDQIFKSILVKISPESGTFNNDISSDLVIDASISRGIRTLLVFDKDGKVLFSNRKELIGRDFSKRDYFQVPLKASDKKQLFISPPFMSALNKYIINITKPILGNNGEFEGLLSATIDPDHFKSLITSLLYRPDNNICMIYEDGTIFVHEPDHKGFVGKNVKTPESLFLKHSESGVANSIHNGPGHIAEEKRIGAFITSKTDKVRTSGSIIISASRNLDIVLSEWRSDAIIMALIYAVISVICIFVARIMIRRRAEFDRLMQIQSSILESAGDGILGLDKEGIISFANLAAESMTGWTKLELKGRDAFEIIHVIKEDGSTYLPEYCPFHLTLRDGKTRLGHSAIFLDRNNVPCPAEYTATAFMESGSVSGGVLVFRDVTERKKNEAALLNAKNVAEQTTRAKSDFLANMSHEIRTPMNTIIGMGHLLAQSGLTPKQKDQMKKIMSAGESLLGIIDEILDFSKIEAGRLYLEKINFDLDAVIEKVANQIFLKASEKGLEILFSVPVTIPRMLTGDPLRLQQILTNLGSNAVKFTSKGEVIFRIEAIETSEKEVKLLFSVKDTGIGIAKEKLAGIFEEFSQADSSTTRKYGGTGLGLAISKSLVELMDGEFSIESDPGKGSLFSFAVTFGRQKMEKLKKVTPPPSLLDLRVLVVDDNASAREIFVEMIHTLSFTGYAVDSGEKAIAELERAAESGEHQYDVILLDWDMPGMNGIETAAIIKSDPKLPSVPTIIMVTAHARKEIIEQAKEVGIEGVLLKPLTHSMLLNDIMDIFGEKYEGNVCMEMEALSGRADLSQLRGSKILVVEDHDINWEVAEGLFSKSGITTERAVNGKEAVERIIEKKETYDIVLMDLQMPVMGGFEATKLIREAGIVDLPIIAMTANALSTEKDKCIEAGMNDYLTKPVNVVTIYDVLSKWISSKVQDCSASGQPLNEICTEPSELEKKHDVLPGIDSINGLNRLDGDRELFERIIMRFVKKNDNLIGSLMNAVEAGDYDALGRIVHGLKGESGNISAYRLYKIAMEMESALSSGHYAKIGEFIPLLDEAMDEVAKAASIIESRVSGSKQERSGEEPVESSGHDFADQLSILRNYLVSGDMQARSFFASIKPLQRNGGGDHLIVELQSSLSELDYDKAIVCLDEILAELKIR